MARRKGVSYFKIEDRDTSYVPLHVTQDRGSCMYLFCGTQSVQGTGKTSKTIEYEHECGQSSCTCPNYSHNTDVLPQNKQTIYRTMLMKRHRRIAQLFSENFGVRIDEVRKNRLFSAKFESSKNSGMVRSPHVIDFGGCLYDFR